MQWPTQISRKWTSQITDCNKQEDQTASSKTDFIHPILGQKYTFITFHEQLYCKVKMLQWQHQAKFKNIIILGGFHVQVNFSNVIRQPMTVSGLGDILEESARTQLRFL